MTINVQVREELFQFGSYLEWVGRAAMWFRRAGHTCESTICIDQNGLICSRGKQFGEAVYPITVYAIDDVPFPTKEAK